MDLNSKTITAEHSQWTRDLQVLVEGSLSLPEGMTADTEPPGSIRDK